MSHSHFKTSSRGRSPFGVGSLLLLGTLATPLACGDDDDFADGDSRPSYGGRGTTGGVANGGGLAGGGMGASGGAADAGHAGDASGGLGGVGHGGATGAGGTGATAGEPSSGGAPTGGGGSGNGGAGSDSGGSGAVGPSSGGTGADSSGGVAGVGGSEPTPRGICADAGAGGADAGSEGGAGGAPGLAEFVSGGTGTGFPTPDLDYRVRRTNLGHTRMPVAINAPGQVIAKFVEESETAIVCRSFLIDPRGIREILIPGGSPCVEAIDINDAGRVVGRLQPSLEPFLWQEGASTTLASALGRPIALNNQNRIIFDSGLLWDAGIVTEITFSDGSRMSPTAMNHHGQIVGPHPNGQGAIWQDGVVTEIPMDDPRAINELGHVLGLSGPWLGLWDGVAFRRHITENSGDGAPFDGPFALNNHDQFVGTYGDNRGDYPAYPYVAQGSRYKQLHVGGFAVDINDRGDIIGGHVDVRWRRISPSEFEYTLSPPSGTIWSRGCPGACCGPMPGG